ncbi:MAG: PKD domain-containing protein [Planctomycetales bacterium]|nr:MAG: PKD domain-containing protein [Planctomycetales bacterium]
MARILITGCIAALLLAVSACSSSVEQDRLGNPKSGPVEDLHSQDTLLAGGEGSGFPSGLPADGIQPWEQLDASGHVQPEPYRISSSINGNTDFTPGIQRFLESGDVAANGEASRLNGTDDSGTSYAMYRVSLQDEQPGIVSVDANLLGSGSEYFVGISDYGHARWDWHGPFSDNHVRIEALPEAGGDLTSTLGNAFITVLVNTGSRVDVVGVGVNQYEIADAQAPSAPAGLALSPVAGGIELEWSPVLEADLAGYAVYYASRSFISVHSAGVQRLAYLEGSSRHLLSGLSDRTWVAISAVDFSGNESAATAVMDAGPLAGDAPALLLTGSAPGGSINDVIQLTASGADSYDWDLDGDGVFEVENDSSGSQTADTSATGIIRPRVRAIDASGEAVALGGLSLLVSGNSAPYVTAVASPQSGSTPLDVTFAGTAEDAEDGAELAYAWDFNGDGIFEPDTDTASPDPFTYLIPGLFNARFRAQDSQGAWSVASVPVLPMGEDFSAPDAEFNTDPPKGYYSTDVSLDASGSRAAFGATITQYEWDLDGDGTFETNNGTDPLYEFNIPDPGYYDIGLRVSDSKGGTATWQMEYTVTGWEVVTIEEGNAGNQTGGNPNLALVGGKPAVSFNSIAPYHLKFARPADPLGMVAPWTVIELETQGDFVGSREGLQEVDGTPAIAYRHLDPQDLKYARSSTVEGLSFNDWSFVTVDFEDDTGENPSLAIINGNPAIAYEEPLLDELRYSRSSTSNGMNPGDWSEPVVVVTAGITESSLAEISGKPAIAYYDFDADELRFAYSDTADGTTQTDWNDNVLYFSEPGLKYGYNCSLREINGKASIAFVELIDGSLFYGRAVKDDPEIYYDFNFMKLDGSPEHRVGFYPTLVELDGMPAIGYLDDEASQLVVLESATPSGNHPTVWGNGSSPEIAFQNPAALSAAVINGHLAFVFREQFSCKYAVEIR